MNEMTANKILTKIENMAIAQATGYVLSSCEGELIDGFNTLLRSPGDLLPATIVPCEAYENYSPKELVQEILDLKELILSGCKEIFEEATLNAKEKMMCGGFEYMESYTRNLLDTGYVLKNKVI